MSKIGKQPVQIPDKVEITLEDRSIQVKGPKGTLSLKIPREVKVVKEENQLVFSINKIDKKSSSLFGTIRALAANMVKGVSEGWQKKMELVGTGYRAEVQGNTLVLTVGFISPIKVQAPENITFKVEKTEITVDGIDKEVVGEISAKIRAVRPPEPYQGKGIRYKDEIIKKKPGKAAKTADAA